MEITWVGQACFRLRGRSAFVVTDPFDPKLLSFSLPKLTADIVTVSHEHGDHNNSDAIKSLPALPTQASQVGDMGKVRVLKGPGEYEIKGVNIRGVSSWHDDEQGAQRGKNTIFVLEIDGVRVAHLGDLGQTELTQDQLADIGNVDVLLTPVGGFYTIDARGAALIVAQIEPKVVIPMHYRIGEMGDELAGKLAPVDDFVRALGLVPKNMLTCIAKVETLPQEMELVILERKG